MGNNWININKSDFSFKNLCDLCVLCGELNCYHFRSFETTSTYSAIDQGFF